MTANEHEANVTSDCPRCHRRGSLVPLMNTGLYLFFRCSGCRCEVTRPLPVVTKKVIYLDQFVFSNIVKAKEPNAKEPHWGHLHARLVELAAKQLIVCPFSTIHRAESLLTAEWRDRLKLLYRTIGDVSFRSPEEIETAQLLTAIRSWLGLPRRSDWEESWQEPFESDPHRWTADMTVLASFQTDEQAVSRLRESKSVMQRNMLSFCDYWRQNPRTFDEDCAAEIEGYARSVMDAYRSLAGRRRFDPRMPPGWHHGALLVHRLACEVAGARPGVDDLAEVVQEFFDSDAFKAVPRIDIAARLWATIAQQARSPRVPRRPKAGDHYDVRVLSLHAPYCDAMIVDKEFRAIASAGNVDVPTRYGVRLFSGSTLDDFLDYLRDIEAQMTPEHREALVTVHSAFRPAPDSDRPGSHTPAE